ncbi:MAG: glycoside hydrolase TIM-barrel-like domain-containing protein [Rickettsiales bacterium]
MASIILSSVGRAVGNSVAASVGASIGQLVGSFAGHGLDQMLFGSSSLSQSHSARLKDLSIQSSSYGQMIPIIYSTCRIAGNIIWALPIKEVPTTYTQNVGGKGSKAQHSHTNYSYFATLAISLCEGKISEISRIWANNKLINIKQYHLRIYKGDEAQLPDPIIESHLGVGNAPAYRGQAYVVLEDFPLNEFGNHLPNFNFEVKRKVSSSDQVEVEELIESIIMIPGSGEFVYDTQTNYKSNGLVVNNKWIQQGANQSINEHSSLGKANALVALDQLQDTLPNVKWIAPVVTWFANSLNAGECKILPGVEYKGGATTLPDRWKVGEFNRESAHAITHINARPIYGGTVHDDSMFRYLEELKRRGFKVMLYPMFFMDVANKPWRGRVTGDAQNIRDFFTKQNGYNQFVLHYAKLAKGLVDAFIIGSELIGLTKVKDEQNNFPAVEALIKLALEVKEIVGKDVIVTYAADWSEYHHTEGGWYNLDKLWACEAIDVIGIDAYFPLTDSLESVYDPELITRGWESEEGFDYYIQDGQRQPLGAAYAWKNIRWFWENEHINPDGKKTSWKPKSKRIWFTEYGFPSVDCCTNQPNVFYDPSSQESFFPRYSKGRPDFKAQRTAIYATENFWQNSDMVERKFLWTWDARPHPLWPDLAQVWADGSSWLYGHWVQGKLGVSSLGAILNDLLERAGLKPYEFNTLLLSDTVDGLVIEQQNSVRKYIEVLKNAYAFESSERNSELCLTPIFEKSVAIIKQGDLLIEKGNKAYQVKRLQEVDLPENVNINFINKDKAYAVGSRHAMRHMTSSQHQITMNLPIVMNENFAERIAQGILYSIWTERNSYNFSLPVEFAYLKVGEVLVLDFFRMKKVKITQINFGQNNSLKIEAVDANLVHNKLSGKVSATESNWYEPIAKTHLEILDLPCIESYAANHTDGFILIAACGLGANWSGVDLYISNQQSAAYEHFYSLNKKATIGQVSEETQDYLIITLLHGELHSISAGLFNGLANLAVIGSEIIQFKEAELLEDCKYRIASLKRGLYSSNIPQAVLGERFVLLDGNVEKVSLPTTQVGITKYIKPVTHGHTAGGTDSIPFSYQANSLKPFAVSNVEFAAGRLTWQRRSRFSGVGDLPLAEECERYLVEYRLGEESYTITVTAPGVEIPTDAVEIKVYQLSALVGRGF